MDGDAHFSPLPENVLVCQVHFDRGCLRKWGVAWTPKFKFLKNQNDPKIGVDALTKRGRARGRKDRGPDPLKETCSQLKETRFHLKETRFQVKETCFQLKETRFQLKETSFQIKETSMKRVRCHRKHAFSQSNRKFT